MTSNIGVVGDIHGTLPPLERIIAQVLSEVDAIVFLGDYVNRGEQSCEVIDFLIALPKWSRKPCHFLLGHHDDAFLRALQNGEIDAFLRMGGAATLASYPASDLGTYDTPLRERVPVEHVEFLRSLRRSMTGPSYVAAHSRDFLDAWPPDKFAIFGHTVQRALVPDVTTSSALIDTGCGTLPGGRLTCFLWPSRQWVQAE